MAHQIPTNLFLNLMKEGRGVEVVPIKSYRIRLVTTKYYFAREEGTHRITDCDANLDSEGGRREKYTGSKGGVVYTMPVVFVGLKVKVVDEKSVVEIVRKWGWSIVVSGACVL